VLLAGWCGWAGAGQALGRGCARGHALEHGTGEGARALGERLSTSERLGVRASGSERRRADTGDLLLRANWCDGGPARELGVRWTDLGGCWCATATGLTDAFWACCSGRSGRLLARDGLTGAIWAMASLGCDLACDKRSADPRPDLVQLLVEGVCGGKAGLRQAVLVRVGRAARPVGRRWICWCRADLLAGEAGLCGKVRCWRRNANLASFLF